ncbi:Putative hemolysin [Streptomyces sp. 2224.1]|nr:MULTISPECIES: GNAT family N-acyltransferase [unclassified Streptomyces]PBC82031.1 putative hemolysin [Streptomyces sp. 2321.6]SDR51839.1 Putative hemolysin [Streptomyces sp. KS_16]SEC40731.1 Putative hemolysin [Streptomyces sp. 2133.1]SEC62861.1 Putative hemolysin [Streptomyces sp. 2224.1]SNC67236.1 Putative hemolysin [Streptomyces sp. 2114.4]
MSMASTASAAVRRTASSSASATASVPTVVPGPAPAPALTGAASAGHAPAADPGYTAKIAGTHEQIRAAQRLRHQVFAGEMGATLHSPLPGHDIDAVDDLADHLVVTHTATGDVVGTYRLLPPGRSPRLYSDGEFDLGALAELRPSLIEAGRSCVHPDHRSGAVMTQMWAALARYTLLSGHRYLAGCASVPLADGGIAAAHAWGLGRTRYAAPHGLQVTPHHPWHPTVPVPARPTLAQLPPLLRGYLRIGAFICGEPAHDPEFDVADFFVVLDMERLGDRYRRYFLGAR